MNVTFVKNPNNTKRGLGFENGATVKEIQLVDREGLTSGTSELQVRSPNH